MASTVWMQVASATGGYGLECRLIRLGERSGPFIDGF